MLFFAFAAVSSLLDLVDDQSLLILQTWLDQFTRTNGGSAPAEYSSVDRVSSHTLKIAGFVLHNYFRLYFCHIIFVQNGKCLPFLELTPTLRQMPRDVTNISED